MKRMRVVGVVWLVLGLVVAPGLVQRGAWGQAGEVVQGSEAAPTLAAAKALAAKGRLDAAMAQLDVLAKADPEEIGVERLRGVILYQKESLAEAEAAFGKAMEQDPADRESVEMRGIALYRLGRPAEAIPFLEKGRGLVAANREPTSQKLDEGHPVSSQPTSEGVTRQNVDPSYVLGLCYADAKRYDDARRAFAGQFGFGPDSAAAYLVTARLFLRREFKDEAALFAQKALELDPRLPLAHQLLGEVALAKADLPGAVAELEAEEKLNPLNAGMYDRLGDAYGRSGQFEEARAALNKSILLEPNATGPYILLGQTLLKLGEPIEALHYLTRALAMDASNHVTHYALGQAYSALGRTVEARREFKMSVDMQHKTGKGE